MIYRFGNISVDEARRILTRGDDWVQTEPKVFDVLLYLIKHRERAVMREELLDACWPRVHVSDGTLSRCMSRVRFAIGQPRSASQPIYTLHGKGYRFVAPVSASEGATAEEPQGAMAPASARSAADATDEPEWRTVSLLDCDLTLASGHADDGAEALHEATHRFLADCEAVLQRFGGAVAQSGGGGVVARFGHATSAERAAEAAVLAAGELLERAGERGLAARVGIVSGRAIVDPPGGGAGGASMVVSADPLQPASLRAVAAPQACVVDETTRRLTEAGFTASPAGAAMVGSETVPVFNLAPRERQARDTPGDLIFYGRSSELAFLEHCWRYARDGHGQVIHLAGEAGIGKTRLVRELITRMAIPAEQVIWADCSPYHQLTPFHSLLVLLRHLLGIGPETPPVRQLAAIEALLKRLDQPDSDHLPLLASLLSVSLPPHRVPALRLDPARQRERTLEALVFLSTSLAERHPVLFWVDDVQWADPSTLDVVARVRARAAAAKILVVLAGRTPDKRMQNHPAGATTIALGPFTRAETLSLLDAQGDRVALSRAQAERIATSSDGVPLFLREVMRMTVDENARPQNTVIPDTLLLLLQSRLDQAGEAKRVAQWVALLGPAADSVLLARVSGLAETELGPALARLTAVGLLRESGHGRGLRYAFSHTLLREAAYDSLLVSRRRERHRRIAETLVAEFPETVEREPETIARHYEASDEPGHAAPYWRAAGRASATQHAADEARALYRKALGALRQGEQGAEAAEMMQEIDRLLAEF